MAARLEARATRHYFDSAFQCQAVKVLPNEYYVTNEDLMISTVLDRASPPVSTTRSRAWAA